MIGGIVEIAEEGRHLSLFRGFLKVSEGDRELGRVPLDDISALILSAYRANLSKNIITALLERHVPIITTGKNWHPMGIMLPYAPHYEAAGLIHDQIALSQPRSKRLWQQVVKAKIIAQRQVLSWHHPNHDKLKELDILTKQVKSGDPDNREAQAARHYWKALMGQDFKRDHGAEGANSLLNYGYTILRAATARATVASGLNPALGIFHKNRLNPFALVDDLMEPFRPLVDDFVKKMDGEEDVTLTPERKKKLVSLLQRELMSDKGMSPLFNCLVRLAQSYTAILRGEGDQLNLPDYPDQGSLFT